MISWLETITASVSMIDTFSSSQSGLYFGGSSTSSSSASASENWSRTYVSTTAFYQSNDGNSVTVVTTKLENGVVVPNSGETIQTIGIKNKETSTTAEETIYPTITLTSEVAISVWTTSSNSTQTSFYQTQDSTTVTTTEQTQSTASAFGSILIDETVYNVPWHNTIYRAITEYGEILFSAQTSNAADYLSATRATGQSAVQLTASFNTQTVSYEGASSFVTETNNQVTASIAWKAGSQIPTTLSVCSFAFSVPQKTRTITFSTRTTANDQQTYTYFNSGTVSPARQTTLWYVSTTKQSTSEFQLSFEHRTTRLASVTRWVQKPHLSIPSADLNNGASRGVSVTTTAPASAIVTVYQDTFHAGLVGLDSVRQLRKVYGPLGRFANSSIGAAIDFEGIDVSFTVPSSSSFEALFDREARESSSGSIFRLMPGYYTYEPAVPSGYASLSLNGDSFSFTSSSSNSTQTFSTSTTGVASAFGPSYIVQRLSRPVSSFEPSIADTKGTQAASLNLAGYHIIGGNLGFGETAVEAVPRGVWSNGSATSFYDGSVTTRSSNAPTTALVPLPYFYPQLATESGANNLIWATAIGVNDIGNNFTTALPLPF